MRKKSILLSGAVLLGAAFAVSTYADLVAPNKVVAKADGNTSEGEGSGDEIPTTYINFASSTPTDNGTVLSTEPVTQIWLNYRTTADDGFSYEKKADANILIKKDGSTIQTINCASSSVYVDPRYTDRLVIVPSTPLSEPGVYTVEIPSDIISSLGVDSKDNASYLKNTAQTLTFTIEYTVPYTLAPTPGDVPTGALNTITFTYPEGTVLSIPETTPEDKAGVYYHDAATEVVTNNLLSTYTVSVSGNVVTLTADNPDAIVKFAYTTATKDAKYDYVKVPSGLWNVNYEGRTLPNPALQSSGYWFVNLTAAMFTLSPAPGKAEAVAATDLSEIKVACSVPVSIANTKFVNNDPGNTAITFANLKVGNKTVANYYPKSISTNGRVITLAVNPNITVNTALNDLASAPTSDKYVFTITANQLVNAADGAKNSAALVFSNYNLKGLDYFPIVTSTPKPGAIPTSQVSTITINFYNNARVANADGTISLYKDGTLVQSWKPADSSTAAIKNNTAAGSASAGFKLAKAIPVTEYGKYTIKVDEGTFMWKEDESLKTPAFETDFYFIDPTSQAVTFYPESWSQNNDVAPTNEVSKVEVIYPEGTVLSENPNYSALNVKSDTYIGKMKKTSWNGKAYGSTAAGALISMELDGNKAIFTFKPVTEALVDTYIWAINIPAGSYLVTKDNVTVPNVQQVPCYAINAPQAGTITNFEDVPFENNHVDALADLESITYTATQAIYVGTDKTAVLKDKDGKVVREYTYSSIADGNRKAIYKAEATAAAQADEENTESGVYTFEIPANAFLYGASASTSALAFYYDQPISFEIAVGDASVGVDGIADDNGLVNVYAIDGRIIALGADKAIISELEPGLYIVNGKKIAVR